MIKKVLLLFAVFYLLVLLQTGLRVGPNLIFVLAVLINVLEKPNEKMGLFAGFAGGLLMDVFSSNPPGFYTAILFGASLLIKIILRKYVLAPLG